MTDLGSLYELASTIDSIVMCVIVAAAFSYFCKPFADNRRQALLAGAAHFAMHMGMLFIPVVVSNFVAYGVSVLAGLIVLCVLGKNRILQKIFLGVTFFSVRWLAMAVGGCLYIWMCKVSISMLWEYQSMERQFTLYIMRIIIDNVVDTALLFSISWIVAKAYKYSAEDMNANEFVLMILPSMSGLVGYAMLKFYDNNYKADTGYDLSEISDKFNLMCLFYYLISLITIVVLIVLYQSIKEKQEEIRQNELLNSQMESMKHHINRVERLYMDIRGLRHDMGNHITTLEALYKTGKDAAAGEYMTQLKQKLWSADNEIKSGNPVTDVILSERKQEAQERGIEFICNFHYPKGERINAFDISIILNNALDNAIRAAADVAEGRENAQIRVSSYTRNDIYMLEIENSFEGTLKADDTSRDGHGYGLLNIKKVSQKYCGDMEVECRNGMFKLSVMLVQ